MTFFYLLIIPQFKFICDFYAESPYCFMHNLRQLSSFVVIKCVTTCQQKRWCWWFYSLGSFQDVLFVCLFVFPIYYNISWSLILLFTLCRIILMSTKAYVGIMAVCIAIRRGTIFLLHFRMSLKIILCILTRRYHAMWVWDGWHAKGSDLRNVIHAWTWTGEFSMSWLKVTKDLRSTITSATLLCKFFSYILIRPHPSYIQKKLCVSLLCNGKDSKDLACIYIHVCVS